MRLILNEFTFSVQFGCICAYKLRVALSFNISALLVTHHIYDDICLSMHLAGLYYAKQIGLLYYVLSFKVRAPEGNNLEEILIRKLNVKCSQREVSSCLILKLVTYMNRMLKKAAIQIGDDVEITQNS